MNKIVDYGIVTFSNADVLTEAIKELMSKDWQPIGGVVISIDGNGGHFTQTVVKYEQLSEE